MRGLSYHTVQNVEDCRKIMEKGWHNRTTGATLMNKDSSRSHSIFTIQLEMITKKDSDEEHIRAGKLNLVDLAGSERQVKTGASGDRLKEASKINLSLSALGNVISALVNSKVKHIPYRDSRLTRLLQDSLGGNTKTLMVACLSPADNNYDETLSTLRYANRAKNIKNKPKINEDPKDVLLREYQEEITKLKALLMGQNQLTKDINQVQKENEKQTGKSSSPGNLVRKEELEKEKENLKREYEMHFSEIQAKYEEERNNRAKLQEDMTKLQDFYESKLSFVDGQIAELPTDQASVMLTPTMPIMLIFAMSQTLSYTMLPYYHPPVEATASTILTCLNDKLPDTVINLELLNLGELLIAVVLLLSGSDWGAILGFICSMNWPQSLRLLRAAMIDSRLGVMEYEIFIEDLLKIE
eukprot:XP_014789508.1 PREDICTED: kinesin-like protein KIF17 [Octopus bimaculoides]